MLTVVVQGDRVVLMEGESRIEAGLAELMAVLDVAAGKDEAWLHVEDMAPALGASDSTVRFWCQEGTLPAVKHGRRWAVRERDFARFMEGRQ
jgi:excisionase family DNA binding protein